MGNLAMDERAHFFYRKSESSQSHGLSAEVCSG